VRGHLALRQGTASPAPLLYEWMSVLARGSMAPLLCLCARSMPRYIRLYILMNYSMKLGRCSLDLHNALKSPTLVDIQCRFVTTQVPDSSPPLAAHVVFAAWLRRHRGIACNDSPPLAARVVFAAGLAAAGCQARSKHHLRTTEGGKES